MEQINLVDITENKKEDLETIDKKLIFSDLLKLILSTSSFQDKYSIKLNPEIISILNQIINSNPEYFNSIETSFNTIISDQKIDLNDIPVIIILLSDLYKILYNNKITDIVKGLSNEKCVIILKFTIDVIIKENISDNEKQQSIISIVNNLLDVGSELISVRKSLRMNKCNSFLPFCK